MSLTLSTLAWIFPKKLSTCSCEITEIQKNRSLSTQKPPQVTSQRVAKASYYLSLSVEKWQRKDGNHTCRRKHQMDLKRVSHGVKEVTRCHVSSRWYLFLTDYEQSKAIAQVSQVCHKVHQKQQLRTRERRESQPPSTRCAHTHNPNHKSSEFTASLLFLSRDATFLSYFISDAEGGRLSVWVLGVSNYMWLGAAGRWHGTPQSQKERNPVVSGQLLVCVMSHTGQVRVEIVRSLGLRGLVSSPDSLFKC